MQIERYPSRQRRFRSCGCAFIILGIGAVLAVFIVLALPALPAIALRVAGFVPAESAPNPAAAETIPAVRNAEARSSILLSAAGFGQLNLSASPNYRIITGTDDSGADMVQITIRAEHIRPLCLQYTDFCEERGHPFRRADITLGSGGLVIAGEAFVDILNAWQAIELRLSLSPANAIQIDSVSVNGARYRIPDNELGRRIGEALASANQMLQGLSVQTEGKTYQLADIIITESQLVAAFR